LPGKELDRRVIAFKKRDRWGGLLDLGKKKVVTKISEKKGMSQTGCMRGTK